MLYDRALAHYDVEIGNDGTCTARLSKYNGSPNHQPPQRIQLHKEGRHWNGDVPDPNLTEDIGYAIEIKAKPFLDVRKRNGEHPAA